MRQNYGAALAVAQIMEAVGWIVVIIGGIAGFAALSQVGLVAGLAVGAVGVAAGVVTVAMAQVLRATVDTASNTAEMLAVLRKQSEVSRGQDAAAPAASRRSPGSIKAYKGHLIERDPRGVRIGSRVFVNVIEAERWVDGDA